MIGDFYIIYLMGLLMTMDGMAVVVEFLAKRPKTLDVL